MALEWHLCTPGMIITCAAPGIAYEALEATAGDKLKLSAVTAAKAAQPPPCLRHCLLLIGVLASVPLLQLGKGSLLSFTVNSKKDLREMRKALGSVAAYIEADLTAFTTVRALQDAANSKKPGKEIPVNTVTLVAAETQSPSERPCWADPHCGDYNLTNGERPRWARPAQPDDEASTQGNSPGRLALGTQCPGCTAARGLSWSCVTGTQVKRCKHTWYTAYILPVLP